MKKWIKVKMVSVKRGKLITYGAYLCPSCNHEALIATKYCPECGEALYKPTKDISVNGWVKEARADAN